MAEMEERELLLRSLKGYLTDLADSGVDELAFGVATPAAAGNRALGPADVAAGTPADAAAGNPADRAAGNPAGADGAAPVPPVRPAAGADSGSGAGEPLLRQDGNPRARLLLLMSGPGYDGAAGELLAKIIGAMKLRRDEVCLLSFAAGVDAAALRPAVEGRIGAVAPEVVVTLGEEATSLLLEGSSLDQVRGRFREVRGRGVMPTLHPELLLADEGLKRHVWEDMKLVMRRLGTAP